MLHAKCVDSPSPMTGPNSHGTQVLMIGSHSTLKYCDVYHLWSITKKATAIAVRVAGEECCVCIYVCTFTHAVNVL